MKKVITLFFISIICFGAYAQAPSRFNYQAVIRNGTGDLIRTSNIGMRISILQGSPNGSAVYVETHASGTNDNGLMTAEIGNGTPVSGNFNTINWANGPYFIKTETDPAGGTNYTISGTSQMMSVPYALYAEQSGTPGPQGIPGNDGLTTSVNNVQQVNGNITLTKSDIGLGDVDNTTDADKPVSTATQNALDQKASLASPSFTGTPTVPTANAGTNTTQIASTAFVTEAVTNSNVPDANASTKGRIALGGDLAGTGSTAESPVISANAITTTKLADESVTTIKIADANVTGVKIAGQEIGTTHLVDGAVTYDKIQQTSSSGIMLGRMSSGAGSIEEIPTTGSGSVVFSSSPDLVGTPTAPTAAQGTNTTQVATTEFVKAEIAASHIKETPSVLWQTLSAADAGKIIATQWGAQPNIPDNLPNGFNCTIINYSNSPFTTNSISTAFYFSKDTGWNNGNGLSFITIKSGGTVTLNVIEVNGIKAYFVSGDLQ